MSTITKVITTDPGSEDEIIRFEKSHISADEECLHYLVLTGNKKQYLDVEKMIQECRSLPNWNLNIFSPVQLAYEILRHLPKKCKSAMLTSFVIQDDRAIISQVSIKLDKNDVCQIFDHEETMPAEDFDPEEYGFGDIDLINGYTIEINEPLYVRH